MDFTPSARVQELSANLRDFLDDHVLPAEQRHHDEVEASGDRHHHSRVLQDLTTEARSRGLWNLFMPDPEWGAGLTNLEYAPLAELSGRSPLLAPEAMNCSAPDTGNMEVLAMYGTDAQQQRWLVPLLDGQIRSCFGMTEPDVASSDARNIQSSIVRDGDEYVVSGRKWWTSGAASPRTRLCIFMGKTDPDAETYRQQSMVLVPMDAPGVSIVRELPVFGRFDGNGGHPEVAFDDVRVPVENLLVGEGEGFAIAQGRLGPGRIHHCMRLIGMAERALELMIQRGLTRFPFGKPLARQGVFQDWVAEARVRIDQARLLTLHAAWLMDTVGTRGARIEISSIKVVAPRMATWVIDHAMQAHGAAGMSDDVPLAMLYAHARTLRLADGPDEVHKMSIARREIGKHLTDEQAAALRG